MTDYQPRYVAYARAHGRTPDEQLAHDEDRWPGGCMTGFICWIGERWQEWRRENGISLDYPLSRKDHADFDQWLAVTSEEN